MKNSAAARGSTPIYSAYLQASRGIPVSDMRHLIDTVHDVTSRGVGLKVLIGHGAAIDTTNAAGKFVSGIFAALTEFERELISERTVAGLASARARGRSRGRPFKMTPAKLRLAMAPMGKPGTKVAEHYGRRFVDVDKVSGISITVERID